MEGLFLHMYLTSIELPCKEKPQYYPSFSAPACECFREAHPLGTLTTEQK